MARIREFGCERLVRAVFWLFVTLAATGAANVANQQAISFPGPAKSAKSPDGRYAVLNKDDENRQPAHSLFLTELQSKSKEKLLYSYGRHVSVLWSPKSAALIVNDYEGSDASRPLLFTAPWNDQPLDLRAKLIHFLRSRKIAKSVEQNDHVYFSAERWLSGDEILCKVTGYGEANPSGFTKRYVYRVGGSFRPVH